MGIGKVTHQQKMEGLDIFLVLSKLFNSYKAFIEELKHIQQLVGWVGAPILHVVARCEQQQHI